MNWLIRFLTSSIGQKTIMSLSGLFLTTFLVVHLVGNLQLLLDDGGEQFNIYAKFMTSNPLIKTTSYLLYASILLHAIQGIALWWQNKQARGGKGYAVKVTRAVKTNSFTSRYMAAFGTIILVFIFVHMYQFWLQMKLGNVPMIPAGTYEGYEEPIKNLYAPVAEVFSNPLFVVFYVISMIVIAMHLWHGFQSAFQTLGLNHKKYTPLIKGVGIAYSILVPLGFAILPLYFLLFK
ncbi:MAG: succinate dehydrogenase cytochrome b subunit [Bacteroidota bacterium]